MIQTHPNPALDRTNKFSAADTSSISAANTKLIGKPVDCTVTKVMKAKGEIPLSMK